MKNSGIAVQKPIPIQWFQWNENLKDLIEWVDSLGNDPEKYFQQSLTGEIFIKNGNQKTVKLEAGQIIIRNIAGDYVVTTVAEFEKAYNVL